MKILVAAITPAIAEEADMSTISVQRKNPRRPPREEKHHRQHSIVDFGSYTSVSTALKAISHLTQSRPRVETISARDGYSRVVSADILSPINVPDKQRSHMDGFAVIATDLKDASSRSPRVLSFMGDLDLASPLVQSISSGETKGISTGGALPAGADAVVPVEEARRIDDRVYFFRQVEKGAFCFPLGLDVKKGSVVIPRANAIRAQDIGMLALLGIRNIPVFARPRVAIIATGDELIEAFEARDPRKVRESHSPIFENLIREVGGVVTSKEIVRDRVDHLTGSLKREMRNSDLVLTLGGTSLGEGDLVEQALRRISRKSRIIHGIRMDRGRVAGIAAVHGKPVVMLPGPVQGAMNAFYLLALPLISQVTASKGTEEFVNARISKNWKARKRFEDFTKVLYVHLERKGERLLARPVVGDTESMSVLVEADGFVTVPERIRELRESDEVSVRLLPGFSYVGGRSPFGRFASPS